MTTLVQKRIIEEKYLKGAPSVEAWLSGVARNIALAELLYHPSSHRWGLFNGVRVLKTGNRLLLHHNVYSAPDREMNFRAFLNNCDAVVKTVPEAQALVTEWENKFFNLLSTWAFLPNSPTLMNAGRDLQQLSACYVLPVEDSMEGITAALQAQALIHKSGGGTGFSFGHLRPVGDPVKSTEGVASGVVSFMQVFDKLTEVVKQGGNRRGANMGVLPYWHPEIKEFIKAKSRPGAMENFNLSVGVDGRFFEAVKNDWSYDLIGPRTGTAVDRVSAREVFDLIVRNAWATGDPGLIFLDHINKSRSNPTPALGQIEATNPCGEQPLLPNEPCNLGSINVALFVDTSRDVPRMEWDKLKETIHLAVRFLDNVIDVNNYPLPEIEAMAKGNRRIGLGVMGWAELLVKMEFPYDSQDALALAGQLMEFISTEALHASEDLALERGTFPNWKGSIYDPEHKVRHCARTTIAPTGTIGLAAGLQGGGIEPFYGIAYTRYNAKALDALKKGLDPDPADVYFEVNPLFKAVAKANNFFGMGEQALWKKIDKNKKSIKGIPEIPRKIQELFQTAHDLAVDTHVRMQAAFQEFTDNGVSKTINLPHEASLDDIRKAYLQAYELKCKGITVYRDGSKQQQVLNLLSGEKKIKKARDFSVGVSSEYYEIKTGHGPLHVHIDYDETGPFRVFSSLAPVGTEVAGLASIIGVLISKYLEEGGDPNKILKHLESIKGDRPHGLGENRIDSIPHAVAVALRSHLAKHHWLGETKETPGALELWSLAASNDQCPTCFSRNIVFNAGCSGPLCQDCGTSACS